MKLWRRIVSVIAGTMIATGGVLAAASVITAGPLGTTQGPGAAPVVFDRTTSQVAFESDEAAVLAYLDQAATIPAPSLADRTQAAVAALGVTEAAGTPPPQAPPSNGSASQWLSADAANGQDFDADGAPAQDKAAEVVGNDAASPSGAYDSDSRPLSGAVTVLLDSAGSADSDTQDRIFQSFGLNAYSVLNTPLVETRAYSDTEASDTLGLKGAATDPPASVANWTEAAAAELEARFDGATLEHDTLNVSLASQALREGAPLKADALNAELRYRQGTDGSFEDIRSTSEAARALALGGFADQQASIRALNWLDSKGTLTAPEAVYRLRAHAYDGMLIASASGATAGPPPAPATGGSDASRSFGAIAPSGMMAAGLWFLAGGIGLSLSLVTVDALKGSRQRLYDTVRASPGLHVNELRRRLHMSPSSIEYHLSVLVGAGLVVAEDDGRYKRYYANGAGLGLNPRAPMSRNTLGALRRPHAVTLVRALADRGMPSAARDLARSLQLHESAVARRLAHLEDAGVLVSERQGRSRLYRLADPAAALKALAAVEEAPPVFSTTGPTPAPTPAPSESAPKISSPTALP